MSNFFITLVGTVATLVGVFVTAIGTLHLLGKRGAVRLVTAFGVVAIIVVLVVAGSLYDSERSPVVSSPVTTLVPSTSATPTPDPGPVITPPPVVRTPSPTPTRPTPTKTPVAPKPRTIRLSEMCEPGEPVDGLSRSIGCPYTGEPPIIAGSIFDADATKGRFDGGYYEFGNWATMISVTKHTCSSVKVAFGRADNSTGGSGQHRAFLHIVTSHGTESDVTTLGRLGHVAANVKGSPFQILTSSDDGVPVFVRATLTCTSSNGF